MIKYCFFSDFLGRFLCIFILVDNLFIFLLGIVFSFINFNLNIKIERLR